MGRGAQENRIQSDLRGRFFNPLKNSTFLHSLGQKQSLIKLKRKEVAICSPQVFG